MMSSGDTIREALRYAYGYDVAGWDAHLTQSQVEAKVDAALSALVGEAAAKDERIAVLEQQLDGERRTRATILARERQLRSERDKLRARVSPTQPAEGGYDGCECAWCESEREAAAKDGELSRARAALLDLAREAAALREALQEIAVLGEGGNFPSGVAAQRIACKALAGGAPAQPAEDEDEVWRGVCKKCGSAVLNGVHIREDLPPCGASSGGETHG